MSIEVSRRTDSARLRSLLFCPATNARAAQKMAELRPDAAALDLEDAVTDENKSDARELARSGVAATGPVRTYVRVNNPSTGRTWEDILAVVQPALDGIVLPKVDDVDTVRAADAWLEAAERHHGVPVGSTRMLILIESAGGIVRATDILQASPRVETAVFGAHDYMLDLGIQGLDHSDGAEELLYARSALVVAARAAGVAKPLDGPFLAFREDQKFLDMCKQARMMGFQGKMLIHPRQVELTHTGFAPSDAELKMARNMLADFTKSEAKGAAATVSEGRLVDYPIADRARRILLESSDR
ncbi:CoA ester lyase [Rhodococcus pyridinivorans]|uniref:HpcH/HpaI aldolase/citrate lyase family protein n=1 Tax=Rhodococcus pyridinivorans TaxID=103816 RepID=UPI0034479006